MNRIVSRVYFRFLSIPFFYNLSQNLVGARRFRKFFVAEHIKPQVENRVMDIGCGTAEIPELFPEVDYFGFDMNPLYIELVRKRFGSRGVFKEKLVTADPVRYKKQPFFERLFIGFDRGKYIREPEDYLRLAEQVFPNVKLAVRRNVLYIPYSHAIMEAYKTEEGLQ